MSCGSESKYINDAVVRYLSIIGKGEGESDNDLQEIKLLVLNDDETLNLDTNYHYKISIDGPVGNIEAETPYGAMYALETFSQLVNHGQFNYSKFEIDDEPQWNHRGIMIDAGRRFWPVDSVKSLFNAMSYLKLNTLHFHLTDWCRVSLESKKFPMLTRNLTGLHAGYYTQDDMKELVEYARSRGIRIIPEFDVPGHSKGWAPLAEVGMQFCNNKNEQLYGDPQNKTLNILMEYLEEVLPLFHEPFVHLGADELNNVGLCNAASFKQFEIYLFDRLHSIGKIPIGWEEILFSAHSAQPYCVVNGWQRHFATEVINNGYDSIESYGGNFYLNHVDYVENWVNLTNMHKTDDKIVGNENENNVNAGKARIYGGEMSMWTDNYLYLSQCGVYTGKPVAWELYNPEYNKQFVESVFSVIFPRGIKAAGSLYRFDSHLYEMSEKYKTYIRYENDRLRERGIETCPNECSCDELTKCGKKYLDNVSKLSKKPNLKISKTDSILQIVFGVIGIIGLSVVLIFITVFFIRELLKKIRNDNESRNNPLIDDLSV